MIDQNEAVRLRAYQIWERSGHPDGDHESHWYQAAAELGFGDALEQPEGSTVDPELPQIDNGMTKKRSRT